MFAHKSNSFPQYIFIRALSSHHLLSALLNCLKLVYWPFGHSNIHNTINFCPNQPKTNQIPKFQNSKALLFNLYTLLFALPSWPLSVFFIGGNLHFNGGKRSVNLNNVEPGTFYCGKGKKSK